MLSWRDVPVKGKFTVIKDSNKNALTIGKIYDYDLKNMSFGNWYDVNQTQSTEHGYKGPHERSATNIIEENQYSYLLLSDVEILNLKEKKDYFNKIIFKKL